MSAEPARVLCVDDEPNLLASFVRTLRDSFDVRTAPSGAEALRLLDEAGPFAVVVSDLCMPGMSGIDLLERVRAGWPQTACILLSGHADVRRFGEVAPGVRRLTKPLEHGLLRAAIAELAALKNPPHTPI